VKAVGHIDAKLNRERKMSFSLNDFPITGSACSAMLKAATNSQQIWVVKSIETLAEFPALALGKFWRDVQAGPATITTGELCSVLDLASQVVTLDAWLEENPSVKILIEDGIVVECHLS
jgi:hypothetical protein